MIVDSSNEATQYVLDVLNANYRWLRVAAERNGTVAKQAERGESLLRRAWFHEHPMSIKRLCRDAYGREKVRADRMARNETSSPQMPPHALLSEIVTGRAVNQAHSSRR